MLNIRLKTASRNEFEKDFFKLMNNSGFGKSMENIENHKDMKLVTSQEKYAKYVMKPSFKDGHLFSKYLFAVEMDKPVYLGQAILDLSKTLMYKFHYDYMRLKYGSKVELWYMDIDNFVYKIGTEDFYQDIYADVEKRFNTSIYLKEDKRPLPTGKNKNVIGLMKNELNVMTKFVALRVKMYAYRRIDRSVEEKRCRGAKKCVVPEGLTFDDYKTAGV